MSRKIDIDYFAELARIKLSEEEKTSLKKDIESILSYIDEIQKADTTGDRERYFDGKNIMREDADPHESGEYSKELLENVPKREGDYVKVKKIL